MRDFHRRIPLNIDPSHAIAVCDPSRRPRPRHIAALVLTAAGILAAPPAAAQVGPLSITELNPLYSLHYTVRTEAADPVAAGALSASLGVRYTNVFEYEVQDDLDLRMDVERMINELIVRYGVMDGLEIGGRAALRTDWGGVLDPVIEGFHQAFLLSNGGRGEVPQGEVDLHLVADPDVRIVLPASRGALEDLQLFAKARLLGGERATLSIRAVAKPPTGAATTSAGGTDWGADLLGRWSGERWHFHGQIGAVRFEPLDALAEYAAPLPIVWGVGVEHEASGGVSLLGQLLMGDAYYRGFEEGELDRAPINIAGGVVVRPADEWRVEFSFTEDFPGNNPAVDAALTLIVRHTR